MGMNGVAVHAVNHIAQPIRACVAKNLAGLKCFLTA
jgi:hypothetical protein